MKNKYYDVIVLGSGMAGISIAAELSKELSVCILEKEKFPSYHSTGRSFAFYIESYGNEIVRKLTTASKNFFLEYSKSDSKILNQRGVAHIAKKKQMGKLKNVYNDLLKINNNFDILDKQKTLNLLPCLNSDNLEASIYDHNASDIDVNLLYSIYSKLFKSNQGKLVTDISIEKISYSNNSWNLITNNDQYRGKIIINATGSWADEVGSKFNAQKINIVPKKRTVFCFKPNNNISLSNDWPVAVDIEEEFYFKCENETILASPADETISLPHDAQPDEIDIAIGAERILNATKFKFHNIFNKWAGLRSFVKDNSPVIGFDKKIDNFFWLAGQGGYGIQIAPSLAKIASNIIMKKSNEFFIKNHNINIDLIDVNRFN
tara:strand:- start:59 stop:1186 length:1128 start_codon:yes stop_codon:yes gene_type:complete